MFRLLVIVIPFVVAVGATVITLKLPLMGSEAEHFKKLVIGAALAGLIFSAITWWQEARVANEVVRNRDAASERVAQEAANRTAEEVRGQYEQKISALNNKVAELQARSAQQQQTLPDSVANQSSTFTQGANVPKLYWAQDPYKREDGGVEGTSVRFKVYGTLNIPAFVAICDRPCRAIRGEAGPGSAGTQLVGEASKNVAGYIFSKPRPMSAGSEGYLILQSSGKDAPKVSEFRILGESEVPAALK